MKEYLLLNEQYKAEVKNYGAYVKEHKYVIFVQYFFNYGLLLSFRAKLKEYLGTFGFTVIPFNVPLATVTPEDSKSDGMGSMCVLIS